MDTYTFDEVEEAGQLSDADVALVKGQSALVTKISGTINTAYDSLIAGIGEMEVHQVDDAFGFNVVQRNLKSLVEELNTWNRTQAAQMQALTSRVGT